MAAKDIQFRETARGEILRGVDTLAESHDAHLAMQVA